MQTCICAVDHSCWYKTDTELSCIAYSTLLALQQRSIHVLLTYLHYFHTRAGLSHRRAVPDDLVVMHFSSAGFDASDPIRMLQSEAPLLMIHTVWWSICAASCTRIILSCLSIIISGGTLTIWPLTSRSSSDPDEDECVCCCMMAS